MKFNISMGYHKYFNQTIEAETEEEAKKQADELRKKVYEEIMSDAIMAELKPNVVLSDDNFRLREGAICLVRRWSKWFPARVIYSNRNWRYWGYDHRFQFLHNGQGVWLTNRNKTINERIGKVLCEDGKIGKEQCEHCVARFYCYSERNK